ncbi:SGNH/GDSL hydrolase family protein [Aspergillus aculeatinus CBS 121060]|uniref:SGNH hydrolase n=1 Tax=Aspergillus aculeatinus CBS 121060 TaxID=1448322 RepID=A0ACD1HAH8_9EURO|nr:SGNH hydrolase [Aspergillus aculeatinus CBS 121060]RAH70583.1 SGNH hydrolase [Aspergillus aculeatinus CBS 121060]
MANGVPANGQEQPYKPYDQILLFGDSITEFGSNQDMGFGFHAALQHAYSRRFDVVNRGLAGYATCHAIKVVSQCIPPPERANVRLMTLWFGANDSCLPAFNQYVPLEQYKENLKRIIQHPATVAQNPRILIITPPPINEYQLEFFDKGKGNPHPTRTNQNAKVYAEGARDLAASLGIPVVDVWTAFMTAVGWKEGQPLVGSRELPNDEKFARLFTDGLHLTGEGYRIVYDALMKAIEANWPDMLPQNIPMIFPPWPQAPR